MLQRYDALIEGLKKKDTPILKGYQIFHNFIRTHEGLNGKTPAEACGIKVEGENKWINPRIKKTVNLIASIFSGA